MNKRRGRLNEIRRYLAQCLPILFCLLLFGCATGGKEQKPQLSNTYQDDAVILSICASDDLNLYNFRKHTLKLAIVQVANVEDVQQLLINSEGIAKILDGDLKEKNVFIQPFIVDPGSKRVHKFARMAGVKKVIVVAGYYDLIPNQVVRIFEVPVFKHWEPIKFWEQNRRMGRMAIFLKLGAKGIACAESKAKETPNATVDTL
ncbi:type VI secretion lipoprotein TssJ [Legionella spiritensis]|uniref:Type VI secretion lipoprotein n=1 Tax=Legionella spiritensis TaxID=452 RepID=A0A0W0Z9C6_LEGSP|nr:type VI secretion lipoprotein TssJ [Legionella spiritensis]KTD65732.1 Type VI secretion lipoprotein [Legionella spiritensis]SNV43102.1 Type VI secretion lipoprotein [Legionella spiritensis]VEG90611.1 Type VI secretion lipoprotein [Legionella spiritensis]